MSATTQKPSGKRVRRTAAVRSEKLIYLSAPLPTRGTKEYALAVTRLKALFPNTKILEALQEYTGHADWVARLPVVLAFATALVFLTDRRRWIGWGVWEEIGRAHGLGLPVHHLDDQGRLIPFEDLILTEPDHSRRQHCVQVTVEVGQ